MTHTNRNFAVAYVLLVALPLLGLAGVLRSGRNLSAPTSVGGLWKIRADAARLALLPCGKSIGTSDAGFTVSQSGRNFTLNLANVMTSSASGTIEGTTIRASIVPSGVWAREAGCGGRVLSLTATANSPVNPQSLDGVLSVNDCPACTPVHIQAVREDQAKAKGGH